MPTLTHELHVIEERRKELNAELEVLTKREAEVKKARAAMVTRQWKFTWTPVDGNDTWERPRANSFVQSYRLEGTVTNIEELKDAGHTESSEKGGAMRYYVNMGLPDTIGPRIICSNGGGSVFIVDTNWKRGAVIEEVREDAERVYRRLEEFTFANPAGGDVTSIILDQRHFSWR
jgi:hypothetical protein